MTEQRLSKPQDKAIGYLRAPATIRSHCLQILDLAQEDKLTHFRLLEENMQGVVSCVLKEIQENYPQGNIPYHSRFRHFLVGGRDRLQPLRERLSKQGREAVAKSLFELAVVSVLLDAGAGKDWRFRESATGESFGRSEGLAVASLELFQQGFFSSDPSDPLRVDAIALKQIKGDDLAKGLQVRPDNLLVGLDGRASLLQRLGNAIASQPDYFGPSPQRLGGLFDYLRGLAGKGSGVPLLSATDIFQAVLESLAEIWPDGYRWGSSNLGDIGMHPLVQSPYGCGGLVPFHKLSQWLSYSLFEPLEEVGLQIVDVNALTGLPEYRNGGLLVDCKLIIPKESENFKKSHTPHSEFIVEWRALTVSLLDIIADEVRSVLKLSKEEFPLVKVLQGGTWSAGRRKASEVRKDGSPPFTIVSQGTVF